MVEIIQELSIEQFKQLQNMTTKSILIKFSAVWCKPCEKIKDYVHNKYNELDENKVLIVELDIDKQNEIFTFLKTKKMIKGVPSILLWKKSGGDEWYIPDDSVSGSNYEEIDKFFNRCK